MKFIAKTLFGLEKVLAGELRGMGIKDINVLNRAVSFTGDLETLYKVNYCVRTALSVLFHINSFRIHSKDDLYRKSFEIDWSVFMNPDSEFSVASVVNSKIFKHTGYSGLVVKDAVADYFRRKRGRRPGIDTLDPDIIINVHISNENVDISLDSSGEPLYKRGYRTTNPIAPLNEVLAAGILYLSDWEATVPLTDPMCGSGTIPVEAGLIACRIPPGKFRRSFGFTRWKDFNEDLFVRIKNDANKHIYNSPVSITASDVSEEAIRQTITNVKNAGLSDVIKARVSDFKYLKPSDEEGYLFLNPPYGERLKPGDPRELYSMIGTTLKHKFPGYKAWILTTQKEYLNYVGLKINSKYILYNGPLKCILAEYEMYHGTKKVHNSVNR